MNDTISILSKIEYGLDWALYATVILGLLLLLLEPDYLAGSLLGPVAGLLLFGLVK